MNAAVIVAAGRGTRFGPDQDKLFLELGGLPVVGHTWRRFDSHPDIHYLVLVVRSGLEEAFEDLAKSLRVQKPYRFVVGGKERQDSVWNGLEALPPEARVVGIHDGARPCASASLIRDCFSAAQEYGAAVAAQPVTDTIKQSDDGKQVSAHLDRSRLWAVQTPQCFRTEVIRKALAEVRRRGLQVTDDTAACECIGQPVRLVSSRQPNPKVTVPEDLPFIELLLRTAS